MANENIPNGFRSAKHQSALGARTDHKPMSNSNTTSTTFPAKGDPVVLSSGNLVKAATVTTGDLVGIFLGCEYTSATTGYGEFATKYPGGNAIKDDTKVRGKYIADPEQIFLAQVDGAVGEDDVGKFIRAKAASGQTYLPEGSAKTNSKVELDSTSMNAAMGSGNTLRPFQIVGLYESTDNEIDAAYNKVLVKIASHALKRA